jgi:HSP20 family protein
MASLNRWDPFRDMLALQLHLNRALDDRLTAGPSEETSLSRFAPPVDIFEDAEGVTVSCEVPGVDPKTLDVKVENGTLTIAGERKLERDDKRDGYHRVERAYGSFLRSFALPPTVDAERVKAENRNGVLRVFLPRREESKPRKVSVKIE